MPEKTDLVNDVSGGARALLGRLGEFFHIFDLSFIVSGASTLGALVVMLWRLEVSLASHLSGWVQAAVLIISCYICGLLSFSLGRAINQWWFRRTTLDRHLRNAIEGQALTGSTSKAFEDNKGKGAFPLWRLYLRLWQQLAAERPQSVAFGHLARYWAMAATYDGLAASLLVWAAVIAPFAGLGREVLTPCHAWMAMVCSWQPPPCVFARAVSTTSSR